MPSGAELLRNIKEQIKEVDPREVHDQIENGNGNRPVVVDVREQHEFEEGHIPGAVHVPRGHLETRIEGAVRDRSAPVVLYCASGNRSAFAADTLQRALGYEDVSSMTGGITRWKDRGFAGDVPRALTPDQRARYSRVARSLVWRERARDVAGEAAVLPPRDAAGHRRHVLVAQGALQRVGGERRAVAARAVQDDGGRAVAHGALDAGLQ